MSESLELTRVADLEKLLLKTTLREIIETHEECEEENHKKWGNIWGGVIRRTFGKG